MLYFVRGYVTCDPFSIELNVTQIKIIRWCLKMRIPAISAKKPYYLYNTATFTPRRFSLKRVVLGIRRTGTPRALPTARCSWGLEGDLRQGLCWYFPRRCVFGRLVSGRRRW